MKINQILYSLILHLYFFIYQFQSEFTIPPWVKRPKNLEQRGTGDPIEDTDILYTLEQVQKELEEVKEGDKI